MPFTAPSLPPPRLPWGLINDHDIHRHFPSVGPRPSWRRQHARGALGGWAGTWGAVRLGQVLGEHGGSPDSDQESGESPGGRDAERMQGNRRTPFCGGLCQASRRRPCIFLSEPCGLEVPPEGQGWRGPRPPPLGRISPQPCPPDARSAPVPSRPPPPPPTSPSPSPPPPSLPPSLSLI